ncbi:protein-methionine-sulfoxide reductase catalytic subunit MsrP [Gemmatimonadetes bacterium T265]|nr:protein-methionine-sulfoxide reductase catalytic subunit MsrP [Gemmatimonadetes bacterium T265]
MLIRRPLDIPAAEVTPEPVYVDRRRFLRDAGLFALGASSVVGTLAACAGREAGSAGPVPPDRITAYDDATGYNNFYEFGTDKDDPKANAGSLRPRPWSVAVEGLVQRPAVYALDDLFKGMTPAEHVYRHRCVEAWSMVIPWLGYPLGDVLRRLQPQSSARWVEFTTLFDPNQMPGQRTNVLPWPYVEALRLDEAMHPLTLLATGMYGKVLPNQNGAPLRLVVPWKYGFKGSKSIVKIRVTDRQPQTTWNAAAPDEYGVYANVNPAVDHPRWSQAKERRVGEFRRRATLPFNGYADQVASLYAGMDLVRNF